MKKSLIAIAALAAVGAASAQSSVTLYGLADTGLAYKTEKTKVDGVTANKHSTFGATTGTLNGSRLGVKGAEDLGNGLKATFNYELGFNSANGAFGSNGLKAKEKVVVNTVDVKGQPVAQEVEIEREQAGFARKATVGLAGNFGHVRIGRDNTVVDNLVTATSADAQSTVDTAGRAYGRTTDIVTDRANGVHYDGNFSGFAVSAFVAPSDATSNGATFYEKTKKTGPSVKERSLGYGLSVGYANGPLTAGVAAQQFTSKESSAGVTNAKYSQTQAAVGGAYDFNVAKVYANYIYNRDKETNAAGVTTKGVKHNEANVGVTVPFGAASFVAEYGYNYDKPNNAKALRSHDVTLGANYAFSKRTDVYARAAYQGLLKASGSGMSGNAQTYAVGLRHRF